MNQQPIGVGVIVFDKTKRSILLGKRKNAYLAGWYGMPGGRLETKESLIACGKRELMEETGIEAVSLSYLGVIRELQDGYNFIHFAFVCNDYRGEAYAQEPEKCELWEWYPIDALPTNILPGHRAALEIFLNPRTALYKDLL